MNFTVYDGIAAYARTANSQLYHGCLTSIFNNPADQILTPKGKETLVRQFDSGAAGNYSKTKGWTGQYGAGGGVKWKAYKSEFDRAKILQTDAIDEEQSFAAGMTPSIELLNTDFLNQHLPREIDATNISKWYSQIPAGNKKESGAPGWDISVDGILETLNNLDREIFNSGHGGDTVLFLNSETYANIVTAIQNKFGFASGQLIQSQAEVVVDTGLGDLVKGEDNVITVSINFEKYGRFMLIRVPDDRMYTQILMLSGDPDDVGQESGGYVPHTTHEDFGKVGLMAIPINAAFTNTRYMVDNFLYPASLVGNDFTKVDLGKFNHRMFGNVEINNAGVNQIANAFQYNIRAIYGGSLFDNRAKNCFAVKLSDADVSSVTSVTLRADKTSLSQAERTTKVYADTVDSTEQIVKGIPVEFTLLDNTMTKATIINQGFDVATGVAFCEVQASSAPADIGTFKVSGKVVGSTLPAAEISLAVAI